MKLFFFVLFFFCSGFLKAQSNLYFPPNAGNTWDTVSFSSIGWCSQGLDSLYDYLEVNNTKAFLVLKDGKIAIEKYFGTFTKDSAWYWASAGKTLTAACIGIAQQEGDLSIEDTTSQYLGSAWTNCLPAQEEKITIWNQLTMTSGLDDDVPDHYCTLDTCLIYKADAGTRWAYHNGPYTLLDEVLEQASGITLNAFMFQKIANPIGMTGAFFPSGYNNVFLSKARSMARFGLLMLANGSWNGTPILTDTSYFNAMMNTSQNLNESYGYLWWLNGKPSFMVPGLQYVFNGPLFPNAPSDMRAALGKNGQFINVVPSEDIVLIRMGDMPSGSDVPIFFNDTIWLKMQDVLCVQTQNKQAFRNEDDLVEIYPNPSNSFIEIKSSQEMNEIELVSLSGAIIVRKKATDMSHIISTEFVPSGMYVVIVLFIDGTKRYQKIFVQH